MGKSVGLPTHVLLGGKLTSEPAAFSVIGFGEIDVAVKKAKEKFERGVVAMQLKVGDNPLMDARRVKAIRESLPNSVHMFADANAG